MCADIWSTDCDRLLVAMVSLEKLWVLNMKEHFSRSFSTSGRGVPPDALGQKGEELMGCQPGEGSLPPLI